jgi:ribosomal protein S18 acetylase RimI-like enzyme
VLPAIQGRNIGKTLLQVVEEECREAGGKKLQLNVNRYNKAKQFYERQGFKVIKEENVDLGNGVLQEDFVLEKDI